MMLLALPGAFFLAGSVASLLVKADGRKKWRTQCGTIDLDLASPHLESPKAIPPSPQDQNDVPANGGAFCL